MTRREAILTEVRELPDGTLEALARFMHLLRAERPMSKCETALLSERSLGKDWNSREEDDAWRDL